MDIQLQNALTEWRHFEGYLTLEEKLASLHDVQGLLIDLLLQNQSRQPTIVPTSKIAFTKVDPSVVEEPTPLTTLASSLLDQADTKNGPVGLHSECAKVHHMLFRSVQNGLHPLLAWEWCPVSGEPVLKSSVKIPAQGVDQTSSTSVKQPSKESVESSVEESVKSQSKESIEDGWWLAIENGLDKEPHYHAYHAHEGGKRWHWHGKGNN